MTIAAVGLDLSFTATGIALPDGTCRTLKAKNVGPQARLVEIVERVGARLHANKPVIAVIEGVFSSPKFMQTSLRLAELGGAVRFMLHRREIPFVVIGPTALKFFATGNGNASKQQMVDAAVAHGADVANDNEADAWWLWLAAQQRYEPRLERPLLTSLLTGLPWPELDHARVQTQDTLA